MPISAENRGRYPADWSRISRRIRFDRARARCECNGICGEAHAGRCRARQGKPHPITKSIVVLTVAHLDHQPENNEDGNLRALCQRCHLLHDREHHQENARRTWARKRIEALNNHELFKEERL